MVAPQLFIDYIDREHRTIPPPSGNPWQISLFRNVRRMQRSEFPTSDALDWAPWLLPVVAMGILIFFFAFSESTAPGPFSRKAPLPKGTVFDAVTRRPRTPAYKRADQEFRMGEIYRQRREYSGALQLYRSALSSTRNISKPGTAKGFASGNSAIFPPPKPRSGAPLRSIPRFTGATFISAASWRRAAVGRKPSGR